MLTRTRMRVPCLDAAVWVVMGAVLCQLNSADEGIMTCRYFRQMNNFSDLSLMEHDSDVDGLVMSFNQTQQILDDYIESYNNTMMNIPTGTRYVDVRFRLTWHLQSLQNIDKAIPTEAELRSSKRPVLTEYVNNYNRLREFAVYIPPSKCYKMMDMRVTWFQAKEYCQQKGMEMLNIDHQDEQRFIKNAILQRNDTTAYWIGMRNRKYSSGWMRKAFVWVLSRQQPHASLRGELYKGRRTHNAAKCIAIYAHRTYTWVPETCTTTRAFMCEDM